MKWLCWFSHKWERLDLLPEWVMGVYFWEHRCARCEECDWFPQGWFDPPKRLQKPRRKPSPHDGKTEK